MRCRRSGSDASVASLVHHRAVPRLVSVCDIDNDRVMGEPARVASGCDLHVAPLSAWGLRQRSKRLSGFSIQFSARCPVSIAVHSITFLRIGWVPIRISIVTRVEVGCGVRAATHALRLRWIPARR